MICIFFFFFVLKKIIFDMYILLYLWLYWVFVAVCRLSLVSGIGGHSLAVVHGLLTVVASLVAEHGLWGAWASVSFGTGALSSFGSQALEHRLNSCGAQA